ncbi:MAG: hypothetical protein JWO46_3396 [Nocardioidaceae bacterium]|nr:hypothetical protein [Nocardioidaceae bacterium]
MMRIVRVLGVLLLALGLLAGCGGGNGTSTNKSPVGDRLAAAQKYLDDSKAVTISLSTPEIPKGTQGILSAKGVGTKTPAFKGTVAVVQSGLSVKVPTIAVDGKVYIQFGGSWTTVDPATLGAPDPAQLFVAGKGLSSLIGDVKGAKAGKDTREGKKVLSSITGTLSGSTVKGLIPAAGDGDFSAAYTLDEDDHLVTLKVRGPFYSKADNVTYTIGFSKYGESETIAAP